MEKSNKTQLYDILLKIKNGEEINPREVEDSDNLIYEFKYNKSNPGKSFIKLHFSEYEDYWRIFNIFTDDLYFANHVFSYYSDWNFYDYDWALEDWKNGSIIYIFNDENIKILKKILSSISPLKYQKFSQSNYESAANLLLVMFEKEVSNIIYEYKDLNDDCRLRSAKEMIKDDCCDIFETYGFHRIGSCFTDYITTVSILLSNYKLIDNTSLSLKNLMKEIAKNFDIYSWYESGLELDCKDFDDEGLNITISRELENILDKVQDDPKYQDIENDYRKFERILNLYNVDEWYDLPKSQNKRFLISKIDLEKGKLEVIVDNQKRSLDVEDFFNFLYNFELFEQ